MKDFLNPKYECYVLKLKIIKNKKSNSYKLISQKYFPKISIAGGLYESGDCMMVGTYKVDFDRKYVNISNKNATEIIGVSDIYWSEFTFCIIKLKDKKEKVPKYDGFGSFGLYNSPEYKETISGKCPVNSYLLDQLIELHKSGKFKVDQSIERAHLFGPLSRMIKGYKHIKRGAVQKGDYYWDDANGNGHFTRCDVSFSPIKIGGKIEKRSIGFVSQKKTTHVYYYNEFIIRKI